MKKYLLFLIILFIPIITFANDKVNVYIFHNYNCPHCHEALKYFNEDLKDDQVKLYDYELLKDENAYNRNLYIKVCELLNIKVTSVPLIIIGNDYLIGFSESKIENINKMINFYKSNDYKDLVGEELGLVDKNNNPIIHYEEKEYVVDTIFGKINLKNLSLPLITIVMGLTDGFNPCAMWILLFLISMLFNMKDKKKMWILGLTFIGTSAFVYFLFLMAWININNYLNSINYFRIIIGIFAILFALYNLRNYYKEKKEDGCVVIKKEKRKLVFSNIKKIVNSKSFALSIIGIMILAITVNLIELLCSLGLPMMYTEILSVNNITGNAYYRYIFLYIICFILDDLIVFVISMITLKSTAISSKYNKYSHLIGGIIMLIIGLLLIFKPGWLSFNFK